MYGLVFRLYGVVFHEVTKKIIIHGTKNFRIKVITYLCLKKL
nr:MAG TPA: hypothetical protein [Caudoviricetes sp.]